MTTSLQDSTTKPDLVRPLRLWSQLAQMFGNGFLRENGDEPSRLWVHAVARLTDEQLANGLANLGNDGLTFPPNLSQFVFACKREKEQRPWANQPKQIEDHRPRGRMSRKEWTEKNAQ